MLRNGPTRRIRQRSHAEVGQLASFKFGRSFDQRLGRLIDAKAKSLFPQPPITL